MPNPHSYAQVRVLSFDRKHHKVFGDPLQSYSTIQVRPYFHDNKKKDENPYQTKQELTFKNVLGVLKSSNRVEKLEKVLGEILSGNMGSSTDFNRYDNLLKSMVNNYHTRFAEQADDNERHNYVRELFELKHIPIETLTLEMVDHQYRSHMTAVLRLLFFYMSNGRITHQHNALNAEYFKCFNGIIRMLYTFRQMLHNRIIQLHADDNAFMHNITQRPIYDLYYPFNMDDLSKVPTAALYIYTCNAIQQNNLLRCKDMLYQEILTPSGHHTRCYQPYMKIRDFISLQVSTTGPFTNFLRSFSNSSVIHTIEQRIIISKDPQIRDYIPQRNAFAFRNGIFDFEKMQWHDYRSHSVPAQLLCINYFNVDFDTSMLQCQHACDVPTPTLDSIFLSQGIPESVIPFIKAVFIGRMLFPPNLHDHWEKLCIILGLAGTGKSTLNKLLRFIFPNHTFDVDNKPNKDFGYGGAPGNVITLLNEIYVDCTIDDYLIKEASTGGIVKINQKNEKIIPFKWDMHILGSGNNIPARWSDDQGQMARRLLILMFLVSLSKRDIKGNLFNLLCEEIAYILYACGRLYRELAARVGNQSIDNFIPAWMTEQSSVIKNQMSPLKEFIRREDMFIVEGSRSDVYIKEDEFKSKFKEFMIKEKGMKAASFKWNPMTYERPFNEIGLKVVKETQGRLYKGQQGVKGIFIEGIKSVEDG